ncbi:hypothetical protein B0H13DRAFT_2371333 [Mycena leptocephala]|nr:hypothetical protein B0H13DRAFT_2371333 [Mycena leptocephala]
MARTRSATKSAIPVHQGYARARRLGLTPNDIAQDAQAWLVSETLPPLLPQRGMRLRSLLAQTIPGLGNCRRLGDAAQDPVWGYHTVPRSDRHLARCMISTRYPDSHPHGPSRERPRRRARRPQSAPVPNDDNDNAHDPCMIDVILATSPSMTPLRNVPILTLPVHAKPRRPISSARDFKPFPLPVNRQPRLGSQATGNVRRTQPKALRAHVDALRRPSKPATTKRAWVVFRGRRIGVCDTWATARPLNAYRFALHQGYPDRAQAVAAFEFTQGRGTCEAGAWSAVASLPPTCPHAIPTGGALPTTTFLPGAQQTPTTCFQRYQSGVFGSVECAQRLGSQRLCPPARPTYLSIGDVSAGRRSRRSAGVYGATCDVDTFFISCICKYTVNIVVLNKIKITWRVTLPPRSAEQKPRPNVEILLVPTHLLILRARTSSHVAPPISRSFQPGAMSVLALICLKNG